MHPFWLSHEENRAWLRFSMGRSWPDSRELHAPAMGSSPREEGKGKRGEGPGGVRWMA
jgi:hypothetical protein